MFWELIDICLNRDWSTLLALLSLIAGFAVLAALLVA